MDSPARTATAWGASLALVLVAVGVTLLAGQAVKQPCVSGDWADGRQYRRLCYSDIVPLYGTENLQGGRLPYLDPCPPATGQCDEYPVGTMYTMRLAAWIGDGYSGFYYANAALLAACALAVAFTLQRMAGTRALMFALAPTLAIYAFVNWDLLAVAPATLATLAYLRRKDGLSGALIGLGAAAKLYPALLVVPFAAGRLLENRRAALRLVTWSAGTYAAINLPFALAAPEGWSNFFRFNSKRGADWDSLWFVACDRASPGEATCDWAAGRLNLLTMAVFLLAGGAVWAIRRYRDPRFARWTLGFPLIALFLLTNKVYSPQFSLWLLPWFALALPNVWLFVAFEAADIAVFVTRFGWFGTMAGFEGPSLGAFQTALVVRALVLLGCVVAWTLLRTSGEPERNVETTNVGPATGMAA